LILLLELLGQIDDIAVPDSQPTQNQTTMNARQIKRLPMVSVYFRALVNAHCDTFGSEPSYSMLRILWQDAFHLCICVAQTPNHSLTDNR
jgi:hypothetical protein